MLESMGIKIAGVGAYVPDRVLTNHELSRTVDTSHEWIASKTGIHERRVCGPDEAPSDLGYRAAARCLEHAGVDGSSVDLLVVACATPDQRERGPAAERAGADDGDAKGSFLVASGRVHECLARAGIEF